LRRFLIVLLALVGISVVGWVERGPLLQSVADFWIVSDQIEPADAVAIFGGGLDDRPFAAATYYRRGLVPKIVISNVRAAPAENLGALPTQVQTSREILLRLGVPNSAIETFGSDLSNTHDEALALRVWAERTGTRSIIVPTEIFTARRVRWALIRVFGNDVVIRVSVLETSRYGRKDWWQHEEAIINFKNEIMKYLFYRVKY
jgi:hypothetical protein